MTQKVLSYDLGGTKVAIGVVNSNGRILSETRVPVDLSKGKLSVIRQLIDLGREFFKKHPDILKIGIASAGPLDPKKGFLLNPTNFATTPGNWQKVPITQILSQEFKKPTILENDAAAAILAEHWIGAAKNYDNAIILTLGTGLGTGIICNGSLLRAGRNLHPEAGHMIIGTNDSSAPCGCGNDGCAEAYLSGRNFTHRARTQLGNSTWTTIQIAERARKGDPKAREQFDHYAEYMAIAIHNYARMFCPEIVVFTGSFANTSDLFIPQTQILLKKLLASRKGNLNLVPKLAISKLENNAGLIGAAREAFCRPSASRSQKRS